MSLLYFYVNNELSIYRTHLPRVLPFDRPFAFEKDHPRRIGRTPRSFLLHVL